MLLTATNPWAAEKGPEVQRTDLWRVDLRQPLNYFESQSQELFTALGLDRDKLPTADNATVYASKVSLPPQKISPRRVIQGTVPRNLPGYFDAVDTVRIEFRHDTEDNQSPIMTLLYVWRAIVRAGRMGGRGPTVLLANESSKPQFEFDVGLELLSSDSSTDEPALIVGSTFSLVRAWLSGLQQDTIDRSGEARIHQVTAIFQIREIL